MKSSPWCFSGLGKVSFAPCQGYKCKGKLKKNGRMGDKQSRTLKYKIYKINPDIILVLLFLRKNIWCIIIIISNYAKIIVRKIIHLFFTRMAGGVVNNPEPAG